MSVEKRITKRKMKEDKLVSTTFKVTEYIQKNQALFVIGVIAIAVAAASLMFFKWSGDRKKVEASALLTQAEIAGAMNNMDQYLSGLQNLSDNFSRTSVGKIATLRLANSYYSNKQYETAAIYFDKILDRYSNDKMMAASAAAGKAGCMEAKNNYADAGKYYRQAADYNSGELWTPSYLLKAGQNYFKAGDNKSAQEVFEKIGSKYANSTEASTAKRYLAEIIY